jgi:hypothetical protein
VRLFHAVTIALMIIVVYFAEIYGLLAEMRNWQAGTWVIYATTIFFTWVFAMMTMRNG